MLLVSASPDIRQDVAQSNVIDFYTRHRFGSEDRPTYDAGATIPEPTTVSDPPPSGAIRANTLVAISTSLGSSALAVYVHIEADADNGRCRVSYTDLETATGISRRQIVRLVAKLEQNGFVTIVRRTQNGQTNYLSNEFIVNQPSVMGVTRASDKLVTKASDKLVTSPTPERDKERELVSSSRPVSEKAKEKSILSDKKLCNTKEIDRAIKALTALPRTVPASTFHLLGCQALKQLGWRCVNEFAVEGDDGETGYIDLVADKNGCRMAVEFDRVTPREKSIDKLNQVDGAVRVVVLRTGRIGTTDDRVDFVVVAEGIVEPTIPKPVTAADENDGFRAFAAAYPRKVAKQDALRAWRKLKPSSELASRILAALERHKQQPKWLAEPQFIPYPASWLNGRRWEDEPEMAEETVKRRVNGFTHHPALPRYDADGKPLNQIVVE